MRIAITEGRGQIARLLGRCLRADGHDVVRLIRNPDRSNDLEADGMTPRGISPGDADVEAVTDAIAGYDAGVFAADGGPESGPCMQVDRRPRRRCQARGRVREGGHPPIRQISAVGVDQPENVDPGIFQVYLYAKGGADADLRTRDLAWTIVLPRHAHR